MLTTVLLAATITVCREPADPDVAKISPAGGTLLLAEGKVVLVFPPGAVLTDLMVEARPATNFPASDGIVPGTAYQLEPDGFEFAQPVRLSIHYDAALIPADLPESSLTLATVSQSEWHTVPGSVLDRDVKKTTAWIGGFSLYGVRGDPGGELSVGTATTGEDFDPDGYIVVIDGGVSSKSIALDGTVTFSGLAAGDHTVQLSGVAANCTVSGENPRSVTVPAGGSGSTTFTITCAARTGALHVTTGTTGSNPDPDGYTVVVDGGAPSQAIGTNATVTFAGLAEGDHTVQLSGVASNCSVSGANPRTVTVPFSGTAPTTFEVACTARTGDLSVSSSTTGDDLDPDGYSVVVDGGARSQAIGINATVTFTGLAEGSHSVQLAGVASNCTVSGANPRTVSVSFGGTASTSFDVACSARTGALSVSTSTTGDDLDPDGYSVVLDGGAQSQAIGINSTVTFSALADGDHTIQLTGVASNCTVSGANPRTVTVPFNGTGSTTFEVACNARTGALSVSTSTTGDDLDPDEYSVVLDGGVQSQVIGINGTVTFTGLAEGDHTVQLTGVAANCTVSGTNPRTVTVPFGGTASTTFEVACTARTGDLSVSTSTTGDDLDPDGYTVSVDGGAQSQAIGLNATVTFSALPEGDHTVQLTGVASNCTVSGANPRTVTVPFGGTASTTFEVSCVRNSVTITGISFDATSLARYAINTDLWPVTWSPNGNLYTAGGDGDGFQGPDTRGMTVARVTGDPTAVQGTDLFKKVDVLPTGMVSVLGGTLYVIEQQRGGSFDKIRIGRSDDNGVTWTYNGDGTTTWDYDEPDDAFAHASFVHFGQDNAGAPGGYVYVIAHWPNDIIGDRIDMFRAPEAAVQDRSQHEYFAGLDAKGNALWTSNIAARAGILTRTDAVHWGTRLTFNPVLNRYLLSFFVNTSGTLAVYEGPQPWGPWTEIYEATLLDTAEKFALGFVNKGGWLSADGLTWWAVFSGVGTYDAFCVIRATLTAVSP